MQRDDRNLDDALDDALDGLDQEKRAVMMRLAKAGAFAAPIVTAFLLQGLSIRSANAGPAFSSNLK